jgi:hypothetical protein
MNQYQDKQSSLAEGWEVKEKVHVQGVNYG